MAIIKARNEEFSVRQCRADLLRRLLGERIFAKGVVGKPGVVKFWVTRENHVDNVSFIVAIYCDYAIDTEEDGYAIVIPESMTIADVLGRFLSDLKGDLVEVVNRNSLP